MSQGQRAETAVQWFAQPPPTELAAAEIAPLTAAQWQRDRPDLGGRLMAGDRLLGRCSLWWRQTPTLAGQRLGYIGHWAATARAAPELLARACQKLKQQGCQRAIAPIDGSTWNDYRALRMPSPGWHFFSEPDCPPAEPFLPAGFAAIATYRSALCTDLSQTDPRLERVAARLAGVGVMWRSLTAAELATPDAFAALLRRLYPLIHRSFRRNFLFTPLSRLEFAQRYQPLRAYLRPELCWFATAAGRAAGFLLALPDYSQGQQADVLVVKTLAVRPGRTYAGLGALLLACGQHQARQLGYRRAIHALMHDANPSQCLSDRYAQPWRHYQLFARQL